jgi:hypothetical protein
MYKATGILKKIEVTQVVSEKFKKRGFVLGIPDGEKWTQDVRFELVQDKCAILDNFAEFSEIEVTFVLKGRAWTPENGETKYFNTIQALLIKEAGQTETPKPKTESGSGKHWSGLNGEMAQDHVDTGLNNMLSEDDDFPF